MDFIRISGRRILEAYFLMFLHSCPNVNSGADYANITSNSLNTYTLGEHVGREWGIGKVLRWRSKMDPQMGMKGMGQVGLHKVLGTTVEAIVGGVYHQFVRPPFPRPIRSTIVLNYLSSRSLGSHGRPQILPHPPPPSYPPKKHTSGCSGRIPLTGHAALQERERRGRPPIIPTHTIK